MSLCNSSYNQEKLVPTMHILHMLYFLIFSQLMENDGRQHVYSVAERTVLRQPGDGHCLVHSVRASLAHSKVLACPSVPGLLEMMKFEILSNLQYYHDHVNYEDVDVVRDLEKYVYDKMYSRDTHDLIVYALANCLGVEIRIFELSENHNQYVLYTEPIPPARRGEPCRAVLDLLKYGEHYDALIDAQLHHQG